MDIVGIQKELVEQRVERGPYGCMPGRDFSCS